MQFFVYFGIVLAVSLTSSSCNKTPDGKGALSWRDENGIDAEGYNVDGCDEQGLDRNKLDCSLAKAVAASGITIEGMQEMQTRIAKLDDDDGDDSSDDDQDKKDIREQRDQIIALTTERDLVVGERDNLKLEVERLNDDAGEADERVEEASTQTEELKTKLKLQEQTISTLTIAVSKAPTMEDLAKAAEEVLQIKTRQKEKLAKKKEKIKKKSNEFVAIIEKSLEQAKAKISDDTLRTQIFGADEFALDKDDFGLVVKKLAKEVQELNEQLKIAAATKPKALPNTKRNPLASPTKSPKKGLRASNVATKSTLPKFNLDASPVKHAAATAPPSPSTPCKFSVDVDLDATFDVAEF